MIETGNFLKNVEESDDRYICYNLNRSIRILNSVIEDKDLKFIQIYVANNISLASIIKQLKLYIDWFNNCETVLKQYYEIKLGEKVYDTWFSDIEIYRIDITFNNENDYGAIIYCGDRIFLDHALEIEFDKESIMNIVLNG